MLRRLLLLPLLLVAPLSALPKNDTAPPPAAGPGKVDVKPENSLFQSDTYTGMKLRSIGPALFSGRVVGLAVHPRDRSHYYAAVGSGGVWKTTNAGVSWTPVFDSEGSYSIGYVALDPKNPNTVWVGTGENNSQRSVGYGDGVYKSVDGAKTWNKVGLEKSEHIGKILIDPRDSNVVYVAAQGPLWGPGGERGLYKTTDGGKTWNRILNISDNTGVTDVVLDPRNPDILVAAAYQRRRHVWTLINGGPESAIHRSTDAGKTWEKISSGLPEVDMGRIGLAVAPSKPDVLYASIEAAEGKGGIYRSLDGGLNWELRNSFDDYGLYYGHVVVDPKDHQRIYVMNVYIQVSDDGGETLNKLGQKWMHVDNHCMWIDPNDTRYYLVGCDGGIYESFDRAATWRFHTNLPVTQFYDVTVDDAEPFYNVYGGTQDNHTLGGPARTRSFHGITSADWFVVRVGDGFHCKVDPRDPNIVYAEAQYGDLVRYDRRTGEAIGIKPQPGKGEPPLRWNWDSPLVLSPHSRTRLYFAANLIFRSDDRGDSWEAISPDLSRKLDRDKLPVMGRLWGPDAVAKHQATSLYGNIVSLTESPKKEGLLYVGTDDGLLHVTPDAGKTWRKEERFPGVPDRTYVSRLLASQHNADTVYAAFDNHKNSDFAPYLLKSEDQGKTWTSIAGDLPKNGPVLAFAEDHVDPDLLFVGTEFGLFFTPDGGKHWVALKSELPTISVRDLAIQKRENDLVVGTFGRGIYILDDYSPLRKLKRETFVQPAKLFPPKDALCYIPTRQYGLRGKSFLGQSFYTASNPDFGAIFTYHLSETLQTRMQKRRAKEKKAEEKKAEKKKAKPVPYPSREELRAEAEEEEPAVILEIVNDAGAVVRRLSGPITKGFHRVAWDLREPAPVLPSTEAEDADEDLFQDPEAGPLVLPGRYRVRLLLRQQGETKAIEGEQEFRVVLEKGGIKFADRKETYLFERKVTALHQAISGALEVAQDVEKRLGEIQRAIDHTPAATRKDRLRVAGLVKRLRPILRELRGDLILRKRRENTPLSISEKVATIIEELRYTLGPPTKTQRRVLSEASADFSRELDKLRVLRDKDLKEVEKALDAAGAPWTSGRLPAWKEK
jgi:photosystem II stability/assembly factor-like uncharacterized protein